MIMTGTMLFGASEKNINKTLHSHPSTATHPPPHATRATSRTTVGVIAPLLPFLQSVNCFNTF